MRLSWSHKLFFLANRFTGRSKFFDALVKFCALEFLALLAIVVALQVGYGLHLEWQACIKYFIQFVFGGVIAFALSWLFGWLYPHRRPIVEFPEIKEIVRPLSNWKSLPSDHTIAAFLLVYFLFFHAAVLGISASVLVGYFAWASIVSVARVFAGVHYPRDIMAGFLLASAVAYFIFR